MLERVRKDSDSAVQFMYAWVSFNACAGETATILRRVNHNALFWNTVLGALQTSLFISLGRLFDRDSRSFGLDRLLKTAVRERQIFSRTALARRKAKQSPGANWINSYVRDAHVPTKEDFRRLLRYTGTKRRIYEKVYAKIRNQIFAHSGAVTWKRSDDLFSATNIHELQKLALSLSEIHEALWQLYFNGHSIRHRRRPYALATLRRRTPRDRGVLLPLPQSIIRETYDVLSSLSGRQR